MTGAASAPGGAPEGQARIAWSALVEPGDAVAGTLVSVLGAERSLALVADPHIGDGAALVRACAMVGPMPGVERSAFAVAVGAALDRWRPRIGQRPATRMLDAAAAVGASPVLPGDPEWPRGLDDLGMHAPLVLWRRGRPRGDRQPAVARPCLSVVGARSNTLAGAEACAEITSAAADAGCTTISGGAYGIDAVAHRVAIAAGAPTIAVLAGGIDQLYPAGHVELLGNVGRQGMLLAESPPGTPPTRWRFLARNRLIAAMADAVVEAAARSGALNTAHHAAQLGRPLFAVPGAFSSPASVGCHRLVADGLAQLAVHPQDPVRAAVTARTGVEPDGGAVRLGSGTTDPEVVRVVDALGRRPRTIIDVARRSGLSVEATADALALAELQGLVVCGADGWALSGPGRGGTAGGRRPTRRS